MDSQYPCAAASEPYLDLTKPMSNWFKSTSSDTISSRSNILTEKHAATAHSTLCKSIIDCGAKSLRGFDYCHKHILEDKSSPFRRCSFISKSDYRRCRNPTPVAGILFNTLLWTVRLAFLLWFTAGGPPITLAFKLICRWKQTMKKKKALGLSLRSWYNSFP